MPPARNRTIPRELRWGQTIVIGTDTTTYRGRVYRSNRFSVYALLRAQGMRSRFPGGAALTIRDFAAITREVIAAKNPRLKGLRFANNRIPPKRYAQPWVTQANQHSTDLAFVLRRYDPDGQPISEIMTHRYEYHRADGTRHGVAEAATHWLNQIAAASGGSRWVVYAIIPIRILWPVKSRAAAEAFNAAQAEPAKRAKPAPKRKPKRRRKR